MNKLFKNKSDIVSWLDEYNVINYKLIENDKYNYIVDIESSLDLSFRDLDHIPVKFGNISGSFYCNNNNITNLVFCPNAVAGSFNCHNNKLSNLQFSPETVGGSFYCLGNKLISLEGCSKTVGGSFFCNNNNLTSLKFCPTNIDGTFSCAQNKLSSLEFCPQIIKGDFYCFDNKITDLIHFPNHINGDIYLGDNKKIETDRNSFESYSFEELYPIHLEYKIKAEKKLLDDSISPNAERSPIKIKI